MENQMDFEEFLRAGKTTIIRYFRNAENQIYCFVDAFSKKSGFVLPFKTYMENRYCVLVESGATIDKEKVKRECKRYNRLLQDTQKIRGNKGVNLIIDQEIQNMLAKSLF